MSVYIPWMSMPKTCDDCQVSADCPNDEHIDGYNMQNRPRFCQLVPVPEHGDLIDREATRGKIGHLADEIDKKLGYEKSAPYIMMTLYLNNVDDFPTIIPADKEGEG